jgi:hypothetical protein
MASFAMASNSRFLPHFPSHLMGRPKPPASVRAARAHRHLQSLQLPDLAACLGSLIPDGFFAQTPGGQALRISKFPPVTVFWAFLFQTLHPGMACQGVVAKVRAWLLYRAPRPKFVALGTSAFCEARSRLSLGLIESAFGLLRDRLDAAASGTWLWCGRRVKVIDGSSVSMPDTLSNQSRWPQHPSQKPGCGFPTASVLGLFCLSTGAWLGHTLGQWCAHDLGLWHKLQGLLGRGDVLLGDTGFCSWAVMAQLKKRGIDCVFRLHQARPKDLSQGQRLGSQQSLQQWHKPSKRPSAKSPWSAQAWAALPEVISVRIVRVVIERKGYRTQEVWLATTLTDVKAYPVQKLAELYRRRWNIELFFRDLKTTLGMEVLRCKSAEMIQKEIVMHAIAYNAMRYLILESATEHGRELGRLSFKGSLQLLQQWLPRAGQVAQCPQLLAEWLSQLRAAIAGLRNLQRPGRREPRATKRRPKTYQYLTQPRSLFREIPHRHRYRKDP